MAQYNYNSYRRPSARQAYRGYDPSNNANRIFVPTGSAPGPQEVANPFFQGEQPTQYEAPQGAQYYGSGTGEEPIDKLAYAYGEEAKAEAAKVQAERQLAADDARATANEGIMSGEINPANPAAAAVLDALGVEVTAGMLGRDALDPDTVVKNIYGPRVATGSLPSAEDDLVIKSRRRREAEARGKVDSYIQKNWDNLTVNDVADAWRQHYATFPEFGEERQPPKTREEILMEKAQAEEQKYTETWSPIAKQYGLTTMPSRRGKDGSLEVDPTAVQALMSAANAQRETRSAIGREINASTTRQVQAIKAGLGTKPPNLRSPEGREWLKKEAEANAMISKIYSDADEKVRQMKAIPDPNGERDVPEAPQVGGGSPDGLLKFSSNEELQQGVTTGAVKPNVPFYSPGGNLVIMDETGKFSRVNR